MGFGSNGCHQGNPESSGETTETLDHKNSTQAGNSPTNNQET